MRITFNETVYEVSHEHELNHLLYLLDRFGYTWMYHYRRAA